MAFACDTVTLYGFSGTATLDGHAISKSHGLELEHAALDALISHTLTYSDFPDERTRIAWQGTRMWHAHAPDLPANTSTP